MTLRDFMRVGLAGAIVLFVGIALLFAFEQPPFVAPDETAHVGYAHEIADFDLPEITSPPDVPTARCSGRPRRASGRDDRYPGCLGGQPPAAALRRHLRR